jgi:prophage tail gpP-like protein
MTAHVAKLRVGGKEYTGWESVSITRSLENACSSFGFASTMHDPATRSDFKMRVGAACEIYIDETLVITGFIDEINPSHDAGSHEIPVAGRSKTEDIVDCSAAVAPGQWTKQKVEAIAAVLCQPYGIQVLAEVDTGDPAAKHVVEIGETIYESIERLCRGRGLLLTDDPQGRLVLTRAGSLRATDSLVLGQNMLSCSARFGAAGRFSEYRCYGQRAGDDQNHGPKVSKSKGVATDPAIERPRILVVLAEEQADSKRCGDRATWEAATRAGKSVEVNVRVQGWTQSDGTLWTPNTLTHVTDSIIGVDDDLLIVEVTYQQSNEGTITELKLAPADGFMLLAPLKKKTVCGYWKELQ